MMVGAYANLQGAQLNLMEALVAAYIGKVSIYLQQQYLLKKKRINSAAENYLFIFFLQPEVQVRQVAMKFASTVFAPDHVPSRYLLLLAAGDP